MLQFLSLPAILFLFCPTILLDIELNLFRLLESLGFHGSVAFMMTNSESVLEFNIVACVLCVMISIIYALNMPSRPTVVYVGEQMYQRPLSPIRQCDSDGTTEETTTTSGSPSRNMPNTRSESSSSNSGSRSGSRSSGSGSSSSDSGCANEKHA